MLHITNGESAAGLMREAGLSGDFLCWDDALHEGPAPIAESLEEFSSVRARFVADSGWAELPQAMERFRRRDRTLRECVEREEVALWFERDLFDQLQLIQLLSWFAEARVRPVRLSLVQSHEFLGCLKPAAFPPLLETRLAVTGGQLNLAREAWAAFTAADPGALVERRFDSPQLPYLQSALRRHLQQFPSASDGLSRTERQILASAAAGEVSPVGLFRSSQRMEADPFMGDWSFWLHLERLVNAPRPMLKPASGQSFRRPPLVSVGELRSQELKLTDTGRQILGGDDDWIELNGIDRWLGGVHLTTHRHWRWDEPAGRLISIG